MCERDFVTNLYIVCIVNRMKHSFTSSPKVTTLTTKSLRCSYPRLARSSSSSGSILSNVTVIFGYSVVLVVVVISSTVLLYIYVLYVIGSADVCVCRVNVYSSRDGTAHGCQDSHDGLSSKTVRACNAGRVHIAIDVIGTVEGMKNRIVPLLESSRSFALFSVRKRIHKNK